MTIFKTAVGWNLVIVNNWYHKYIYNIIVYVWSQYDGANIEQWKLGYGWCQNQEAKLKIVGGLILDVFL